jgi:regulator of nucleoside diphosphate kinase
VRLVDVDKKKPMVFTLTFPRDADIETGKLSVLSPVGTAILGHSEGEFIEWHVPAGIRRYKIEKVLYQPEAAGDYHL